MNAMGKIHHQLVESLWVLHVQKMIAFFKLYLKQKERRLAVKYADMRHLGTEGEQHLHMRMHIHFSMDVYPFMHTRQPDVPSQQKASLHTLSTLSGGMTGSHLCTVWHQLRHNPGAVRWEHASLAANDIQASDANLWQKRAPINLQTKDSISLAWRTHQDSYRLILC